MNNQSKGFLYVLMSAMLWGLGGIAGQLAFSTSDISTSWLIVVRMAVAGIVLLMLAFIKDGKNIFNIFRNKSDLIHFLIYCFLGNWLVQYSYFEAIKYSNAATATLLQYLSPSIVLVVVAIRKKKFPSIIEICCVFFALLGLFLISTHGSVGSLAISGAALMWGILSALSLVVNSVVPISILKKYGSYTVVGFAMLIGSITTQILLSPMTQSYNIPFETWKYIVFVVIFGTTIPFAGYSAGIKIVGSTTGSIIANIEPLTAAIGSVIILHTVVTGYDIVGFCLIIGVAVLLSVFGKKSD